MTQLIGVAVFYGIIALGIGIAIAKTRSMK